MGIWRGPEAVGWPFVPVGSPFVTGIGWVGSMLEDVKEDAFDGGRGKDH